MRFALPLPQRSQPLLVRIATAVIGIACLAALAVFGALALAILVVGGLVWLVWFRWRLYRLRKQAGSHNTRQDASPSHATHVIEGEYVVVHEHHETPH
ncbi:MAG TPA: hypothetical protein VF269_00795 [Rhodanobacteraceae bacterium]